MTVLAQWNNEREGNDSWLRYNLSIVQEWDDVVVQLKTNHTGWAGDCRETSSFKLDPYADDHTCTVNVLREYISDCTSGDAEEATLKELVAQAIRDIEHDDSWHGLSDALLQSYETTD